MYSWRAVVEQSRVLVWNIVIAGRFFPSVYVGRYRNLNHLQYSDKGTNGQFCILYFVLPTVSTARTHHPLTINIYYVEDIRKNGFLKCIINPYVLANCLSVSVLF
jgi:hypothetical protein